MKAVIGQKIQYQVVFIGSYGVGKTTAVKAISDTEVISMEAIAGMEEGADPGLIDAGKVTTTVGFDYGELGTADEDDLVSIYGIPGQARFEQVWDTLLPRCSGVVLWVFGNNKNYLQECGVWLETLKRKDSLRKLAVALTRIEDDDEESIDSARELVVKYHPFAPVLTADPRDRDSVLQAVLMALSTPYPDLDEGV
ncbi:MAG: hypothetical protein CSB24_03495 [Deltaproteobacteria bacterium]|nr:MAG: hypothetical protein CSB24_03495 [Deltaproteobacteria bacterium]